MRLLNQIKFLLHISSTQEIIRRYFVVNGFDGALAMLGLIIGFLISQTQEIMTVISACLGMAIALGVSGVSSAYISEVAERKRALAELEEAMVKDLGQTAHGDAARWMPIVIALVNGLSPLGVSLLIMWPLWMANAGVVLPLAPLHLSVLMALFLIFLFGIFLGRISGIFWLKSGIQTLLIALVTIFLIYLFAGF